MKNFEDVIKRKPNIPPLPKAIEEVFGNVEVPRRLPDKQPRRPRTISSKARRELLDFTKELRKVKPTSKIHDCETQNGITCQLYTKALREEANGNHEN